MISIEWQLSKEMKKKDCCFPSHITIEAKHEMANPGDEDDSDWEEDDFDWEEDGADFDEEDGDDEYDDEEAFDDEPSPSLPPPSLNVTFAPFELGLEPRAIEHHTGFHQFFVVLTHDLEVFFCRQHGPPRRSCPLSAAS